ncbi:MAG TPA: DNA-directed RNA polymerase subunit alpha [Candidatus Pacearchaeota archaeon]|nr:DNA-directed RNA polymerase subunit alpha [Candidatus Pacearchaeota archaeon]HOK94263.1 DNA-directed RNA polymerase subunit alpha [Candidatus Pacearchaeota archaeon]HPO75377.1 DNA-directed RNA polymerase subunit alpha [Candidatus Pacearchaeota archaeon]
MVILPKSLKVLEKNNNRMLFEIEPLFPGYGITIGNALRRVLLSSIEGSAITKIKIKGVSHEFSVISGVKEDVLEIILNLKQVRLKVFGDEPQKLELKVNGEKEVKAGDIKTPSQVEIVNKDLHIATLTSPKAALEIEMEVQKGFGFELAEKLQEEESKVGAIYLDAIFTPIKNVAFSVENIRFEQRTDFNKLKMEIETDGTILPEEALKIALDILIQHFESIKNLLPEEKIKKVKKIPEKSSAPVALEELGLSTRIINILKENGIKSVAGLLRKKEESLKKIEGLGSKGIEEIEKELKKKGLRLN